MGNSNSDGNVNPAEINDHFNNVKILIAEDDEVTALLITEVLQEISDELIFAKTGVEAVKAFLNNSDIGIVLMDIQMPEMDGFEATRQIRELDKDVIIIAQTAYALSGDRERSIEAGCNDYISKPVNKDKLLALIQKHGNKLKI